MYLTSSQIFRPIWLDHSSLARVRIKREIGLKKRMGRGKKRIELQKKV